MPVELELPTEICCTCLLDALIEENCEFFTAGPGSFARKFAELLDLDESVATSIILQLQNAEENYESLDKQDKLSSILTPSAMTEKSRTHATGQPEVDRAEHTSDTISVNPIEAESSASAQLGSSYTANIVNLALTGLVTQTSGKKTKTNAAPLTLSSSLRDPSSIKYGRSVSAASSDKKKVHLVEPGEASETVRTTTMDPPQSVQLSVSFSPDSHKADQNLTSLVVTNRNGQNAAFIPPSVQPDISHTADSSIFTSKTKNPDFTQSDDKPLPSAQLGTSYTINSTVDTINPHVQGVSEEKILPSAQLGTSYTIDSIAVTINNVMSAENRYQSENDGKLINLTTSNTIPNLENENQDAFSQHNQEIVDSRNKGEEVSEALHTEDDVLSQTLRLSLTKSAGADTTSVNNTKTLDNNPTTTVDFYPQSRSSAVTDTDCDDELLSYTVDQYETEPSSHNRTRVPESEPSLATDPALPDIPLDPPPYHHINETEL